MFLVVCRWHCEYGPEDFSKIVKDITPHLLPKPKKKFSVSGLPTAGPNPESIKSPAGRKPRKPPRKFKEKPAAPLDLNSIPEDEHVQAKRRRASRKDSGDVVDGMCPPNTVSKHPTQLWRKSSKKSIPLAAPGSGIPARGVDSHVYDIDGVGDSIVHDTNNHSEVKNPSCARAPRKKKLPDLNIAVAPPKSPKKKVQRKSAHKSQGSRKTAKSGSGSIEGIGSILTLLCSVGSEHLQ